MCLHSGTCRSHVPTAGSQGRACAVTLLPFFLSSFLSLSYSASGMMDLPTWKAFDA